MSRNEGKIGRPGDESVEAAEILAALAKDTAGAERRRVAVSRYLAAGEGWREASAHLGGAFAAREEWLRREEEE